MIKYDNNHVITGCDDGYLRFVEFSPNRIRDLIGSHESPDDENEKIEIFGMSISHCNNIIGTRLI